MLFLNIDCITDPNIPTILSLIGTVITLIQIAIPIILIIVGSIDLGKAVFAGKEDEIKKNQGILVKRAVAAVLVFFVATIVKLVMGIVPSGLVGSEWKVCWCKATGGSDATCIKERPTTTAK